jgi:TPR repeat protein
MARGVRTLAVAVIIATLTWPTVPPVSAAAVSLSGAAAGNNDAETLDALRREAESGNAEAEFQLGTVYDLGHVVKQDFAQAAMWYRKAAAQGHAAAEFNFGAMCDNGRGVPRDRAAAAFWYRRAARHGNARAPFDLGQMYEHGEGVPRDAAKALSWYRIAAGRGIAAARRKVAALTPPPRPAAPRADPPPSLDEARAEYERGLDYFDGSGVVQDSAAAFAWFEKAAAHGYAPAAYGLGYLHEHGEGVEPNRLRAYAWYRLAAERLPPGAVRDAALVSAERIAATLEPPQLTEAKDFYISLRSQIPIEHPRE